MRQRRSSGAAPPVRLDDAAADLVAALTPIDLGAIVDQLRVTRLGRAPGVG